MAIPGMLQWFDDPIIPPPVEKKLTFEEKVKTVCTNVASRVDAFFLKTPALLWAGLLQTAKIAIKFTVCVLTLNQCRRLCESWSFSGTLADLTLLGAISLKVAETAKVVVSGPTEKYMPSYKALPLLLAEVFFGEYHNKFIDSKGHYHGVTLKNVSDMFNRP